MTLLALAGLLRAQEEAEPPPLLLIGGRILDVIGARYQPTAGVLIQHGRISAVYTAALPPELPEDTRKVELKNQVLVPGLADMHAYAAPSAEMDADYFYALGLAWGVTSYRTLDVPTNWAVGQRARVATGDVPAPRIWTSGRGLDAQMPVFGRSLFVRDPAEAAREVQAQIAAHVDWISGGATLPKDVYQAIVAAARRGKVRVAGRPGATAISELAEAGVGSIEGVEYPSGPPSLPQQPGSHSPRGLAPLPLLPEQNGLPTTPDDAWLQLAPRDEQALVTTLRRRRIALVSLLAADLARAFPEEAQKDAALEWLPARLREAALAQFKAQPTEATGVALKAWERRAAFIKRYVKAGGTIATGTDIGPAGPQVPGIAVHRELAALVRAGLTPAEALKTATVSCAALVNESRTLGQITPGYGADLFAVQGDPLANIDDLSRIVVVVRGGELMQPKALLEQARRAMR